MKYTIDWKENRALALFALAGNLFLCLLVGAPEVKINAWMCTLLGTLACLAVFGLCGWLLRAPVAAQALEKPPGRSPALLIEAALLLLLLKQAAEQAQLLAVAANYATMTSIRPVWLILPLCVTCFLMLRTNGRGVAGAARLWAGMFPLWFFVVLLQHAHSYNFRWLAPVLGAGMESTLAGGACAAGKLLPFAAYWLLTRAQSSAGGSSPLRLLALAGITAAMLLALHAAMLPTQLTGQEARVFQLDTLVSNGRASIASQLPMTVILFATILAALIFSLLLAAALVQRLDPGADGQWIALGLSAALAALSLSGATNNALLRNADRWAFPAISGALILRSAAARRRTNYREGGSH